MTPTGRRCAKCGAELDPAIAASTCWDCRRGFDDPGQARREALDAIAANAERALRSGANVRLGIGVVFGGFGAVVLRFLLTAPANVRTSTVIGVSLFALLWVVLAAVFIRSGLWVRRRVAQRERLRLIGTPAMATVLSCQVSSWRVDGETPCTLRLLVELPGKEPWTLTVRDAFRQSFGFYPDAKVKVLVNEDDPQDVMVDQRSV